MAKQPRNTNISNKNKGVSPLPVSKQIGQPRLMMSGAFVDELGKEELKLPNLFYTVDQMALDPAISQPYELSRSLDIIGLSQGWFESTGSRSSDILTEYGNYLIHNIPSTAWYNICCDITTSMKYGFNLQEIDIRKKNGGEFSGSKVITNISSISPKSVYAWVWDEYQRNITHVVQKPLRKTHNVFRPTPADYRGNIVTTAPVQTFISESKYPLIPIQKILHTRYNPLSNDPQGQSAFIPAFTPWQEKIILSRYQVIGVTRDLGGTALFRLDPEFMKRAQDPENRYPEDKAAYEEILRQGENMTAGEQAFFVLSSDTVDGKGGLYSNDLKLIGVEGAGKQFDTNKIIEQKINEIHNAFGTGFLGLGQNGQTSSYNLATAGRTTHHFFRERDLLSYCEVIRTQILKRLLDANGIDYSYKDLPKFRYRQPDQLSYEEWGKFVQRVKSVEGMTEEMMRYGNTQAGLPTEGIEEIDFHTKGGSRAGESLGSGGTGSSQEGGVASTTNMENKQLHQPLNLVAEDQGDYVALVDVNTGDLFQTVDKT